MLKGLVSLLLLDLLARREDYGYSLVVRLRERGFTELSEGTVYPALARIEQSGWIGSFLAPSEQGPARKYYTITAEGEAERRRAREAFAHLADLVSKFDSRESDPNRKGN